MSNDANAVRKELNRVRGRIRGLEKAINVGEKLLRAEADPAKRARLEREISDDAQRLGELEREKAALEIWQATLRRGH